MVDSRLSEGQVVGVVEKAGIENIEEGEMNNLNDKEEMLKKNKGNYGIGSLVEEVTKKLKRNVIKDHYLQFLLEPLISIESTFKYLTVRRNLS